MFIKSSVGISFDFKKEKKKSIFMLSDFYQFIQERTISIIAHSINLNPLYNDQNGWGNSMGVELLSNWKQKRYQLLL